jgi:hypothetical protein
MGRGGGGRVGGNRLDVVPGVRCRADSVRVLGQRMRGSGERDALSFVLVLGSIGRAAAAAAAAAVAAVAAIVSDGVMV